jgi:hypothetical protein
MLFPKPFQQAWPQEVQQQVFVVALALALQILQLFFS